MDQFGVGGIPGLGQVFSPLGGMNFGANPFGFSPDNSLAAMRAGGMMGGPNQMAEQMLMSQMQMNTMLIQLLTMLLQLMGGRNGMMPGGQNGTCNSSPGGVGGSGGGGGGGGSSPSGSGTDLSAPPADPSAQIPSFGANPSKQQLNQQIEAAAQKYGIPPDILKAIFYKESRWNPAARGDGGKSYGIGQVYTTAHPDYDIARGQQDVSYQIEYSARLLSGLYKSTGDWRTAVRKYNGAGPSAEAYADDVMNNLVRNKPWQQFGV